MKPITATNVAMVCHEANRALCMEHGDCSQAPWHETPAEVRESAYAGVVFARANPEATPEMQHEAWLKDKAAAGWVYGETKDAEAKTHPCMLDYKDLPGYQQRKDRLFQAIVKALS